MTLNDLSRPRVLLLNDSADFLIHLFGSGVTDVSMGRHVAAEKHLRLIIAIHPRTQLITHTPALNHFLRQTCRLLKIVRGPSGHLVHKNLLGDTTTHQDGDTGKQVISVVAVAILLG